MKELFVTRAAEADLLEIWCYLFERNEQAADRIAERLSEKCDLLLEHPFAGRSRPDCGPKYRSVPVGNYVIFYRVLETEIEISRVLHGARDVTQIFRPDSDPDAQWQTNT